MRSFEALWSPRRGSPETLDIKYAIAIYFVHPFWGRLDGWMSRIFRINTEIQYIIITYISGSINYFWGPGRIRRVLAAVLHLLIRFTVTYCNVKSILKFLMGWKSWNRSQPWLWMIYYVILSKECVIDFNSPHVNTAHTRAHVFNSNCSLVRDNRRPWMGPWIVQLFSIICG